MVFKEAGAHFKDNLKFKDYTLDFAASEASRFSKGDCEDASARIDLTLSAAASASAKKHRARADEMKRFIRRKQRDLFIEDSKERSGEMKAADNTFKNSFSEKNENNRFIDKAPPESRDETKEGNGSKEDTYKDKEPDSNSLGNKDRGKDKDSESKKDGSGESSKKEISKETKKAASKTAIAKMLRAKGLIGNDLSNDKVSGDAFRDGNTGAVRAVTEILNPATYLKGFFFKLAALAAPHVMVVLMYLTVFMILVSITVGMFSTITEASTDVTNYMTRFSGRSRIISEKSLSDEKIEEIVSESGASGRQEDVIRFALSRVGYPYSQSRRASGSAYDCSSLAYYSWQAAGVDISFGGGYPPTAASEASMLQQRGEVISNRKLELKDMEPGDLVFYGGHNNGRFLGIYHVAVYVGNGEVVEALNTDHGVVYQTLRTKNIILVLRP